MELKPCPFCGADLKKVVPDAGRPYWAHHDANCFAAIFCVYEDDAEAWNQRTEQEVDWWINLANDYADNSRTEKLAGWIEDHEELSRLNKHRSDSKPLEMWQFNRILQRAILIRAKDRLGES